MTTTTAPEANNPLIGFANKHSLRDSKSSKTSNKVFRGLGRSLKYGALELEKYLINPVFSGAIRSLFGAQPLSQNSVNSKNKQFPRNTGRNMTGYNKQKDVYDRTQIMMLDKIYQISVQNERHLRGINNLIGLTKETNTLLKNFIMPKVIRPVNKDLNPFEIPKPANSNINAANDNLLPSNTGVLGSILGSVSLGASTMIPSLVKVLKKFLSKTLTKIPIFGPLLGVMLNLPDAMETFEKEGFGAAFTDLISGTLEDISFGLIDKEKFKSYFVNGLQALYDGISNIGEKVSNMFSDVVTMVNELLKKIKIGPIKIPDILGGGIIQWNPFEDGLKIDVPPPPTPEPAGVGDEGGQTPYVAPLNTVAYADQLAARQDAIDPRRDKNIEVIGQWEGRRTGDIITPEMLRNETGGGQQDYLDFLKMLIDSGQAKLTDKPSNVEPRIERLQPLDIPDSAPGPAGEIGSVRTMPFATYVHTPLPRRSLFSTPAQNERVETFIRQNERAITSPQQSNAPVIINAPVTNVTGASGNSARSNERTPMGSATMQNTWELRAAHGIIAGVP